mmetsp:Transcript_17028/g.33271  ORF Transcript_17028/g.33271 Transcript_17028/m.33271 type:complete len:252 (+) Transcript_17028:1287-2042(+)
MSSFASASCCLMATYSFSNFSDIDVYSLEKFSLKLLCSASFCRSKDGPVLFSSSASLACNAAFSSSSWRSRPPAAALPAAAACIRAICWSRPEHILSNSASRFACTSARLAEAFNASASRERSSNRVANSSICFSRPSTRPSACSARSKFLPAADAPPSASPSWCRSMCTSAVSASTSSWPGCGHDRPPPPCAVSHAKCISSMASCCSKTTSSADLKRASRAAARASASVLERSAATTRASAVLSGVQCGE